MGRKAREKRLRRAATGANRPTISLALTESGLPAVGAR